MTLALLNADSPAGKPIVTINLVAVDSLGRIVEDLHSQDLRVFDAGQRRTIVFLRRIGDQPWNPPALGPNEVSNRGDAFAPHATVVVLDLFNEDFPAQANAAARLIHDLPSVPGAESLFLYVLTVEGRLLPVHDIPFALHFHSLAPTNEPPWTAGIKALMDDALKKALGPRRPNITISDHANLTFDALDSLAVQLSRIPGRKNIVWINNGKPLTATGTVSRTALNYSTGLHFLSQRLNSFGVALYARRPFVASESLLSVEAQAAMDQLVAGTGGKSNQGEEIGEAIRQAIRDSLTSYLLGYAEPAESWDGKLHKLRVTTNRRAVQIQTKADYLAAPGPPNGDLSRMTDSAAIPPFDTAQIGLRGVCERDPGNPRTAHLRVLVNSRDLALIHENDLYTGILRVAIVGYEQSGRTLDAPVVPFELVFHHAAADADLHLNQNVTLGSRVTKIRLIVIDKISGTIGTLTFAF